MDLRTGLRNPTRHENPDWAQIFADIAAIEGKTGPKTHILYSGPEKSVDLELQVKDKVLMSQIGEVSFSKTPC